ncbi:unnamed protein product [Protopolystoma xenopodis]|uniref:Uncharacterized protein n=1 Tax=Protopolystoma xenopodis TaxID=117903 RepID=A0A3S5AN92_9PLAT|nr:unnamed protein product [Protopolystoma xenopodis]
MRALQELAAQRRSAEAEARRGLEQREAELSRLRSQLDNLTGQDESRLVAQVELAKIRKELESLRTEHPTASQELRSASESSRDHQTRLVPPNGLTADQETWLTRLIEERDSLLRTGVYDLEDAVIADLDSEIRRLLSRDTDAEATLRPESNALRDVKRTDMPDKILLGGKKCQLLSSHV